jgi:hypothetical protein
VVTITHYFRVPREKFRSDTIRKGEPQSHKDSCNEVERYCKSKGYQVCRDWAVPVKNEKDYYHEYDLAVFRTEDFYKDDKEPVMIIEVGDIGDDSKHNPGHKQQVINDGIAQAFITRKYKKVQFFRLNKEDIFYESWLGVRLGI